MKTRQLIFFLHGSGDRGDNLFLLAKASPFMMIREKGPLSFIIVNHWSFIKGERV